MNRAETVKAIQGIRREVAKLRLEREWRERQLDQLNLTIADYEADIAQLRAALPEGIEIPKVIERNARGSVTLVY